MSTTTTDLIAALEAAVAAGDSEALFTAADALAYDIGEDIGRELAAALARAYVEREKVRAQLRRAVLPAPIVARCA